jgi:hypothetical protein
MPAGRWAFGARHVAGAMAAALVIPLLAAGDAHAAWACAADGGVVAITLETGGSVTVAPDELDRILVDGAPCGTASVGDTTDITISGGAGDEIATVDLRVRNLTAPDGRRVRVAVDLGLGTDHLVVRGGEQSNYFAMDAGGIWLAREPAAGPDVVPSGVETAALVGGGANDKLGAPAIAQSHPIRSLTLDGRAGNDELTGGFGGDLLVGGAGNDHLDGRAGGDRLAGGAGDDRLSGNDGADAAAGGDGSDFLGGGDGRDELDAGAGQDTAAGGAGADGIVGGRDVDELFGGDGFDLLVGRPGADLLAGGRGNDSAAGGPGRDRMTGGSGRDLLRGGERADTLLGGSDRDALRGGPGVDTCYRGPGGAARSSCERPRSGSRGGVTAPKRILVINQNLKEVHTNVRDDIRPSFDDQERSRELWNFARRLKNLLPKTPDVLLLQEVSRSAAVKTAGNLSARFGVRFAAVVRPARSLWVKLRVHDGKLNGVDVYKKNTAIVVNTRTIKYVKGGYLSTPQLERDRTDGIRTIQHQAHALLREKQTGIKVSAMSIHFNSNNFFPSPEQGRIRRTVWSKKVAAFARRRYTGTTSRLIAGEFCQRRCRRGGLESIGCEVSRFWRILTHEFGYRDAVFAANRTSDEDLEEQARSRDGKPMRIDYIFARPKVVRASRDIGYTADKGDSNYISDHRGNWALVEIRR